MGIVRFVSVLPQIIKIPHSLVTFKIKQNDLCKFMRTHAYTQTHIIIYIYIYGMGKLRKFFSNAKITHPNITFTYEASTSLPILDVLMKINNAIYTTVCCKPTDRHGFLHLKTIIQSILAIPYFFTHFSVAEEHAQTTETSSNAARNLLISF